MKRALFSFIAGGLVGGGTALLLLSPTGGAGGTSPARSALTPAPALSEGATVDQGPHPLEVRESSRTPRNIDGRGGSGWPQVVEPRAGTGDTPAQDAGEAALELEPDRGDDAPEGPEAQRHLPQPRRAAEQSTLHRELEGYRNRIAQLQAELASLNEELRNARREAEVRAAQIEEVESRVERVEERSRALEESRRARAQGFLAAAHAMLDAQALLVTGNVAVERQLSVAQEALVTVESAARVIGAIEEQNAANAALGSLGSARVSLQQADLFGARGRLIGALDATRRGLSAAQSYSLPVPTESAPLTP